MPYRTGPAACRLCGYQWTAVQEFEPEDPQLDLECPHCHNMTGEFETDEDVA